MEEIGDAEKCVWYLDLIIWQSAEVASLLDMWKCVMKSTNKV